MRLLLKTLATVALVALTIAPAFAQSENCVFFSEYVEGSSNNKALEIFNGTGAPLDMGRVTVERYNNGATTPGSTNVLAGTTIPVGGVYVIVNASAAPELLALGDATYTSSTWFNGDDTIVLLLDGLVVDVIGQLGFDPGTQWGTGTCTTKEHTLRRKVDICCGDTNSADVFDPAVEWDCFAQNDFTDVGQHASNCVAVPVDESSWSSVKVRF